MRKLIMAFMLSVAFSSAGCQGNGANDAPCTKQDKRTGGKGYCMNHRHGKKDTKDKACECKYSEGVKCDKFDANKSRCGPQSSPICKNCKMIKNECQCPIHKKCEKCNLPKIECKCRR